MIKYRGYYIDKVVFNSKAEIDKFVEEQAVERFKNLAQYFAKRPTMKASRLCILQMNILHDDFGYSWERIEQLEIEAIA